MKFVFVVFMLVSIQGVAQCKTFVIGVKGDTLNCMDYHGQKQGRWVVKIESLRGEPGYEEEGIFFNDKKEGTWRKYSMMGDLLAMENYRWGNKNGKNIYFNNMGNVLREESWKAVNPDNPYDTIPIYDLDDPTKITGKQVIKLEGQSLRHGEWTFYDPFAGTISKTEKWWLDKPALQASNEDDLSPIDISGTKPSKSDSASTAKKTTKPQAILDYEKKNAGKKKIKVREGKTGF